MKASLIRSKTPRSSSACSGMPDAACSFWYSVFCSLVRVRGGLVDAEIRAARDRKRKYPGANRNG